MGDYLKHWLLNHWQTVALVLIGLYVFYSLSSNGAGDLVNRLVENAVKLQTDYGQMQAKVAKMEGEQKGFKAQIAELDKANAALKQDVKASEEKQKELADQLAHRTFDIRGLDTKDTLQSAFSQAFPKIAKMHGVGIYTEDVDGIKWDYFVMPAYTLSLFLEDRESVETAKQRIKEYETNEKRYGNIVDLAEQKDALQAKVLTLETQKGAECQAYVQEANQAYKECNKDFISYATKPRVDFGKLGWGASGFMAGAVAGFGMCVLKN